MKVSRGFSLELKDMETIETIAKKEGVSDNDALALLIRNGKARLQELEARFATLAPDNSDLR